MAHLAHWRNTRRIILAILVLLQMMLGLRAHAQPPANDINGHTLLNLSSIQANPAPGEVLSAEKKWAETTRRVLMSRWKELVRTNKTDQAEFTETELKLNDIDNYIDRIDEISLREMETNQSANAFKLYIMTGVIVFLGTFVLGYFLVAMRTASSTFSGDAGLQFAALFSIIIAIIMFGVLNILEGKELSALLGGLSGYILGRGSRTQSPSDDGGPGHH